MVDVPLWTMCVWCANVDKECPGENRTRRRNKATQRKWGLPSNKSKQPSKLGTTGNGVDCTELLFTQCAEEGCVTKGTFLGKQQTAITTV